MEVLLRCQPQGCMSQPVWAGAEGWRPPGEPLVFDLQWQAEEAKVRSQCEMDAAEAAEVDALASSESR